jgi:nicotinic acid mononucleotide adenylyltransferase
MFETVLERHGWHPDPGALAQADAQADPLDRALDLALALAGMDLQGSAASWREAMQAEARRRLYPLRFGAGEPESLRLAEHFFPLAEAALPALAARDPATVGSRLPFTPLGPEEQATGPSGEEYRALLEHLEAEGFQVCLAMAQHWRGLSIQDHVLGVTGLALWIGRQLARAIPVDLPLLHGAAIGHDVGKFGCVGDEARRIPRLHYYYTHQYYAARGLAGIGHIATNHSCWDLERIRLPIETQVLIYCDFRVKEVAGTDGRRQMAVISLKEAFDAILDKLEDLDRAKRQRYEAVYRKLRDLEDYALTLGVDLEPPGFPAFRRARPRLPPGLDVVAVMAGRQRPDLAALAHGPQILATARHFATAHNIGVMERLRDVPALGRLLEEARSAKGERELRTYLGIVGDYAPAFSAGQKALAFEFFKSLLTHPDDDIRYQTACRMADLLALGESEWLKDLPDGVVVSEPPWVLPRFGEVLDLLDLAPHEAAEDMSPSEQVLYSVPIFLRRFFRRAQPRLAGEALALVVGRLLPRAGDRRPLVGLYTCEAFELLQGDLDPDGREALPKLAQSWAFHEVPNVRLMAWRLLLLLTGHGEREPRLLGTVGYTVELLGGQARAGSTVAELFLLERLAQRTGNERLASLCRALRERDRNPVREVMLRNLKGQVGWVEKKVNCDYLLSLVLDQAGEAGFASEAAFHFTNLLKVSRVEGTRFNAGRCLVRLLPVLTDTQRNDLAVELIRSLQLDAEGVTRYLPQFLGPVLASLPAQELEEIVMDMEADARRGSESLQRLLVQAAAWLVLALPPERLEAPAAAHGKGLLRRLAGILLGALADPRMPVAHEGYAHVALLLDRLPRETGRAGTAGSPKLGAFLALATKKLLSLVTHLPGEHGRFFRVAQTLSALDKALLAAPVGFPKAPGVGLLPGTFDPFTAAHGELVARALGHCDEVWVQVDDFSWRKHAQPRKVRNELAWMALAAIPGAYLAPFSPPVNLAHGASLEALQGRLGRRRLHLIVGTDVLEGASAYRDPGSPIWRIPHLVITREEHASHRWMERLEHFQAGVQVFQVGAGMKTVSSTSLREAFDRRAELERFCDPLIARVLRERRLYVNYPPRKEEVFESSWELAIGRQATTLPAGLETLARLDLRRLQAQAGGRKPFTAVLQDRASGTARAAATWMEATAGVLPVALEDEVLAQEPVARLLGSGAVVSAIGADPGDLDLRQLDELMARMTLRWFSQGLLFALFGLPARNDGRLWDALRHHGAGWLSGPAAEQHWAGIQFTNPLVLVHDLEQLLQPQWNRTGPVQAVIGQARRAVSGFFAGREPGSALLHIHEMEAKRQLASWVQERLRHPREGGWVVLGLGRQFSRDLVGNVPTLALDLERCLTWQGYEAGMAPAYGSPSLEEQLTTARELGRNVLLLVPFLEQAEAVLQVCATLRKVRLQLREVLVGVTSAAVHTALHLAGVPHRAGLVLPHWRGVLRESAMVPYVGGWSILGRRPLAGSLLPSLNDTLPYHEPHPLGLDREGALDFSRLALEQAFRLFGALEDGFRAREGRALSLMELSAVVRTPRCPPFPEGFSPDPDRSPSALISEDLEALARLLPEAHHAHREGWRRA